MKSELMKMFTCSLKTPHQGPFPAPCSSNSLLWLSGFNSSRSLDLGDSLGLSQNLAGDDLLSIKTVLVFNLLRSHLGSSPNPDTCNLTRRSSLDGIPSFLTDLTAAVYTLD